MSEIAYIGIGSNIEPRRNRIREALAALDRIARILSVSSIYESSPYGFTDQPPFLNLVAAVATETSASGLHVALKQLEGKLGRKQRARWHEREIDFDILFFGEAVIATNDLVVPHADLINRSFVLIPLAEIAPNIIHPVLNRTVEEFAIPFRTIPPEVFRKIEVLSENAV